MGRYQCPNCIQNGCHGGTVYEHGKEYLCECRCHGEFCPICERIHERGRRCNVKRSRFAREAAERRNQR